jgi:hypothetical protein
MRAERLFIFFFYFLKKMNACSCACALPAMGRDHGATTEPPTKHFLQNPDSQLSEHLVQNCDARRLSRKLSRDILCRSMVARVLPQRFRAASSRCVCVAELTLLGASTWSQGSDEDW